MDKVKIRNNCEKLIELTHTFQECKKEAEKKLHTDSKKVTHGLLDSINEGCEHESEAIKKFFDLKSDMEVREILSVMYGGRDYYVNYDSEIESDENQDIDYDEDEKEDPDETIVSFEEQFAKYKNENREGAIISIMDKSPLIDYLTKGMNYFSI